MDIYNTQLRNTENTTHDARWIMIARGVVPIYTLSVPYHTVGHDLISPPHEISSLFTTATIPSQSPSTSECDQSWCDMSEPVESSRFQSSPVQYRNPRTLCCSPCCAAAGRPSPQRKEERKKEVIPYLSPFQKKASLGLHIYGCQRDFFASVALLMPRRETDPPRLVPCVILTLLLFSSAHHSTTSSPLDTLLDTYSFFSVFPS